MARDQESQHVPSGHGDPAEERDADHISGKLAVAT